MYQEPDFQKAFVTLWAAMLEYGTVVSTNDKENEHRITYDAWNQYSGEFDGVKTAALITPSEGLGEKINWDKTTLPFYKTMGEFTSTGDPHVDIECMIGMLKMKNGDTFWIATRNITDIMRLHKQSLDSREIQKQEPDLAAKWGLY